ncbi:MAG: DUF4350 domain-containing protein [Maribacter sp.]
MDKRTKIIIGIFVAVLIGIIVTEIVRPKPLNWRPSYTAGSKIPFGCFVLFNELPTLFSNQEITSVDKTLYEVLVKLDTVSKSNYLMINNGIDFDQEEYDQMLSYVSRGNNVFIASTYFGGYLSDTLNLRVDASYSIREDTVALSFTNTKLKTRDFPYTKGMNSRYFSSVDTLNTTILGHINYKTETYTLEGDEESGFQKKPNFIKVNFGEGHFYLNATPLAFSNFYMLGGNEDYVANTFSYLKDHETLFWDNYKKSGRVVIDSPMRFVLNQTSLKWAYYLTLVGVFCFYIFRSKREQRIIPVIKPLENSSVEFARTVGSLYYQHKDYNNLIAKKINYFLEFIRSSYYINTTTISERTAKDLSAKSGKPLAEVKALMDFIQNLKNKSQHTEHDLIELNKKITSFKK